MDVRGPGRQREQATLWAGHEPPPPRIVAAGCHGIARHRDVGWEGQSRLGAPGDPTPRGPGAGRAAEAPRAERTSGRERRAVSRDHAVMHAPPLCSVVVLGVLPTPPVALPSRPFGSPPSRCRASFGAGATVLS